MGPTDKFYVGISKNVKERWRSHKARAFKEGKKHPLYDAMRKYGETAFSCTTLCQHATLAEAQASEIATIKMLSATDRMFGYNLSDGGEYDALIGPKIFWDRMHSDPVAFAAYRANLCAAQQKQSAGQDGRERAKGFLAYHASLTPRERYRRSMRALRMGGSRVQPMDQGRLPPHGPRSRHLRASLASRASVTAIWAGRSDERKREVFDKISATLKDRSANDPAFKVLMAERIEIARAAVDRKVQAAAASKGQKAWWAEVRKDPERYATYMAQRRASLMATLERKKNARTDV